MDSSSQELQGVLAELERQVERGSQFTQAIAHRGTRRIGQAEATLAGLLDVLVAKGVVSQSELEAAFAVADEVPEDAPGASSADTAAPAVGWPTIAIRTDSPGSPSNGAGIVDCEARLPACKAVCCRLRFALSAEEVDRGRVKWDLGHPYVIRHDRGGTCTHCQESRCQIYDDRPRVCRDYDCSNDWRIWKDFDAMVLNDEWIAEHLGPRNISVDAVVPLMSSPA